MSYRIIKADTTEKIEKRVQDLMEDEWEPRGDLMIIEEPAPGAKLKNDSSVKRVYLQVMIF